MKLLLVQPALRGFDSRFNLEAIEILVSSVKGSCQPDDVVLLPEHFSFDDDPAAYDSFIAGLARTAGCTVVGGSHHRLMNGRRVNYGAAVDSDGKVIGTYTKLRPYFDEQRSVSPGDTLGEFRTGGRNFLVLICADFWYSDLILSVRTLPDVILVPALSVSRKTGPEYSASLWKHLAISRSYEFGAYIGISDWGKGSTLPKYRTCGVGGLADPTQVDPEKLFSPLIEGGITSYQLDFGALEAFRNDRRMRGFFWK